MPDTARRALQNDGDDIIITEIQLRLMKSLVYHVEPRTIGHIRITFGLFFKASPGAHNFI